MLCAVLKVEKEGFNGIESSRAGEGAFREVIITSGIGGAAQIGRGCRIAWCAITDDAIAIESPQQSVLLGSRC